MREINSSLVTEKVARLFQEANYSLPEDVVAALKKAQKTEESERGREVLRQVLENAEIAAGGEIPLCQDTGVAVVFLEIGQDVHIDGDLTVAINEGVRRGYQAGYLRKSMVVRPLSERRNSEDNTPAVIHTEIVAGDTIKVSVMPKGGGAENMTRLAMLTPAQGRQGIVDFALSVVDEAGGAPCPPVIIGIGIGGTAEKAALLAKKALLRRVGEPGADPDTAGLEKEILERTNRLGIGPMGYGGRVTALAVHAEVFPCHIASLPVVVNLQCHSARHLTATI
ncbi:MAG: fumarate hydratase [Dehalococcoidia bacterium]|nr:MAG: fumarate hydratase [Dehalococcoidia bacterium]